MLRRRLANTDEDWHVQTLLFFVLTFITRLPFRSRYLFDHDSVQFALGLKNYDVYLHQPHPPGYFLYVYTAKLIDFFVHDANTSLVWISVLASALAVAAVYNLGSAIFGRRHGWWAALLAVTSPLFWFFGEIALSYAVAAFFSSMVALGAWRVLHHDDRWVYPLTLLLGVGAGFRQDLGLFLGPLWLYALTRCKLRVFVSASLLLLVTVSLWFIPMLIATGGAPRYFAATSELWRYNNAAGAIWNSALSTRVDTLLTLVGVLSYGVGLATVFLLFGAYIFIRNNVWSTTSIDKLLFFIIWLAPALLFFTIVFIPPYKYSYGLVFLPAFLVLTPVAVQRVYRFLESFRVLPSPMLRHTPTVIFMLLVASNAAVFCLTDSGFSVSGLRTHERLLSTIFAGIRYNFPSTGTLILGRQRSTFSGFRHIQYYLPKYQVFLIDQQTNIHGQKWHAFGARDGKTTLSNEIKIPAGTKRIIFLADPYFPKSNEDLKKMNLHTVRISNDYLLYYRNIEPSGAAQHAATQAGHR